MCRGEGSKLHLSSHCRMCPTASGLEWTDTELLETRALAGARSFEQQDCGFPRGGKSVSCMYFFPRLEMDATRIGIPSQGQAGKVGG